MISSTSRARANWGRLATAAVSAVTVAVTLGLVGGCTSSVDGAPRSNPSVHLVPGTIQASFVSMDAVSSMVGVTLESSSGSSQPPAPLPGDPASCAVAVGPGTQSVYGPGWTVFGSAMYQDSDSVADHAVTQVLGKYSTAAQAATVFATLTDGIKGCPSAVRTNADQSSSTWTYEVSTATSDALSWTATEAAADGWACYREARLKGAAVLQVAVCEAGDGQSAAQQIAGQFAGKVSG